MTKPLHWRSRIVGHGDESPAALVANPANYRRHPKAQAAALAGVLGEVGWVQDVIVNKTTGKLIDGHLRLSLALERKEPTIPVVYVELTDAEEALVLATIDPLAAMAETDAAALDALLRSVSTGDAAVQAMLSELADEAGLDYGKPPIAEDPGAQIDRAEELREKWQTEREQLWTIPSASVPGKAHRLLCGDSTSVDDVARLMGGAKAEMVWTDPPYGVNYGDKLEAANPMGYRVRHIENDDLAPDKLEVFIRSALAQASRATVPGASIYVACPSGTLLPILIASFMGSGFDFRWGLVWVKDQLVLGRGDYHFKHENILYGWKPDAAHYFTADRTQTSVFEVPRPKVSDEHPTMKPPELVAAMIQNSSRHNDAVLDLFLGSGTTMVAAEQTGRVCYGCDIEPKYVAVALERMSGLGLTPTLMAGTLPAEVLSV